MFSYGCNNKAIITSKLHKTDINYVSDSLYNAEQLLNSFAEILNDSLEMHRDRVQAICRVENGIPKFFFVFDLVDTLNNTIDNDRIAFRNKHVYHFSTISFAFSYSNICVLNDRDIIIFRNVNCPSIDNNIEEVLNYVRDMLQNNENKEQIINQIKNYRKYSRFIKMDNYTRPPDGCK
jgi:hypothetical protein